MPPNRPTLLPRVRCGQKHVRSGRGLKPTVLAELWAYLTIPCPPVAQRLGYLREAIALAARHRRCRVAWQSHLEYSRHALLTAADACDQRRTALILGSGHLLDVPLAELAGRFEKVLLVDILHPPAAHRQARRYANVHPIEHDLTECAAATLALPSGAAAEAIAALGRRQPTRFLIDDSVDFVASLNLLSQLPLAPAQWLLRRFPQHPAALINRLALDLMQRHLEYLNRFDADVCLIADAEQITCDHNGNILEHTDYAALLLPKAAPFDQWWWDIAPTGEVGHGINSRHRVLALNWSLPARRRP